MTVTARVLHGDALEVLRTLADESVHTVVTSPPYWGLRDYGTAVWEGGDAACDHLAPLPGGFAASGLGNYDNGLTSEAITDKVEQRRQHYRDACRTCGARRIDRQIGLEATPEEYVARLVRVFREVRRVLRQDGTLWLNLGDSYASGKGTCFNPGGGRNSLSGHKALKGQQAYPLNRGNVSTLKGSGLKPKDLVGIPWRVAFALQADGWYLRSDIVWSKPNPMPESVLDRPTKSHEYLFLLAKSARYYYDGEAIREPAASGPSDLKKMREGRDRIGGKTLVADDPRYAANVRTKIGRKRAVGGAPLTRLPGPAQATGHAPADAVVLGRNRRSVWTVATVPYPGAHFATFPPKLIEPCILAGCPPGGTVLDPFVGSGTTLEVAVRLGRSAIGIDLNPAYVRLAEQRSAQMGLACGHLSSSPSPLTHGGDDGP